MTGHGLAMCDKFTIFFGYAHPCGAISLKKVKKGYILRW